LSDAEAQEAARAADAEDCPALEFRRALAEARRGRLGVVLARGDEEANAEIARGRKITLALRAGDVVLVDSAAPPRAMDALARLQWIGVVVDHGVVPIYVPRHVPLDFNYLSEAATLGGTVAPGARDAVAVLFRKGRPTT